MKSLKAMTSERIIRPKSGFISIDFAELWRYCELFWFLALRDILVRYKQTVIGIAWAVIQPVLLMIVFTVIFGKVAKLPSNGIPYPILTFVALLPWLFFSDTLTQSSQSAGLKRHCGIFSCHCDQTRCSCERCEAISSNNPVIRKIHWETINRAIDYC